MRHSILRPVGRFLSTNPAAAKAFFHLLLLWFTVTDVDSDKGPPSGVSRKRTGARPSEPQEPPRSLDCVGHPSPNTSSGAQSQDIRPGCSAIIIQALLALRSYRQSRQSRQSLLLVSVDTCSGKALYRMRLYSAAVFFVEHGVWDQEDSQAPSSSQTKTRTELLHQAYMNIDDPDAFYGITDGDVRELLLKRLHHEGQCSARSNTTEQTSKLRFRKAQWQATRNQTRSRKVSRCWVSDTLSKGSLQHPTAEMITTISTSTHLPGIFLQARAQHFPQATASTLC